MVRYPLIVLPLMGSDLCNCHEAGLMKKDGDKPRFVLFRDNGNVNTPYMAAPFPNVSSIAPEQRRKESYNIIIHSFEFKLSVLLECMLIGGVFYECLCLGMSQSGESLPQ